MFGYIRPFKPEMKIAEFEIYQSVYCGLCKQLGRTYGLLSRMTLSYDYTFAALLLQGLASERAAFSRQRCIANPLRKRVCMHSCADLALPAGMAMIFFYYKVRDNIADSSFLKKMLYRCLLPLASRYRKKAAAQYPDIDQAASHMMQAQLAVEQTCCGSLDRAAHPFAEAMEQIFMRFSSKPDEQRILRRIGYLAGRWIYLIDAIDDLDEDQQKGRYNPLLYSNPPAAPEQTGVSDPEQTEDTAQRKKNALAAAYMTAGELASAYELLSFTRFKPILDNIIYLGLRSTADAVFNGTFSKKVEEFTRRKD